MRFPSADELRARASRRAGLDDFGDGEYIEGLETLLASYEENPYINDLGRRSAASMVINALVARLESEARWKEDDRWRTTLIDKPVFIIGLPRTGTTAAHKLIAQDPAMQSFPYWLGMHPQPRPPRDRWEQNAGFVETQQWLDMVLEAQPEMRVMHEMAADEPEECRLLRMQSIADITFDGAAYVPRYRDWLLATDHRATYARYRKNLQLIASGDERTWILKCPGHLYALDALLATFPDARIVHTHRAPEEAIPSSCSLRASPWRIVHDDMPPEVLGNHTVQTAEATMRRVLEIRDRADRGQFYDMDYRTFVAHPIAEIERIYDHFGMDLPDEARDAIRRWHEDRPRERHGQHRYTAADFGLDAEELRRRFADYRDRFGLS